MKTVVGLTGTLGSGKSVVAEKLRQKGACIVDMDLAGKWAVEHNNDVQEKLRQTFGDSVFDEQHHLKRRALGEIVFSDAEALRKLNDIIHPAMLQRAREWVAEASANPNCRYVVVDAAILFELGFDQECDVVVTVTAPKELCLQRAVEFKGLTHDQALRRMEAQLPQEEKIQRANYVLDNDSTVGALGAKVDVLHRWLLLL